MGAPGNGATGAVMWLVLAAGALVAGVASASEVRGALEEERAYRAAPECASVPVEPSGCRWRQDFTVQQAELHRRERSASPEARLLLPSGKPWPVTFRTTDPVASELEPGDKVTGVIWHGQVVEVREGGRTQQTTDGPVGWPADRLGGALACLSFGLTALPGSLWTLLARGNRRHARAGLVLRWHGVVLALTGFLTLFAQGSNSWPLWSIPAIWGPLALLLLASTTAFALAALRGELHDEETPPGARGPARVPPPGPPPGARGQDGVTRPGPPPAPAEGRSAAPQGPPGSPPAPAEGPSTDPQDAARVPPPAP
ncbi:hypothetical protein [Streptomyces sp. HNM0574]|uniref:hypothetical protein n=1 Tax=Streptomyces sp. HNM0574 TaxID=2714954 RepID=UPI0019CF5B0E|nr:hypothetical protein [Streptomyces sp. HNM0574]